MNYELYRASVGIDNAAMIGALQGKYPRYGKATQSMINNPEKYGVCLVPEAEAFLASAFGPGLGLASLPAGKHPIRQSAAPRRTKPNRMVVYLSDDLFCKVRELMSHCGFSTVQEFLEASLNGIVDEASRKNRI